MSDPHLQHLNYTLACVAAAPLHEGLRQVMLLQSTGKAAWQNGGDRESSVLPNVPHEHGEAQPFTRGLPLEEQLCPLWQISPFALMLGPLTPLEYVANTMLRIRY